MEGATGACLSFRFKFGNRTAVRAVDAGSHVLEELAILVQGSPCALRCWFEVVCMCVGFIHFLVLLLRDVSLPLLVRSNLVTSSAFFWDHRRAGVGVPQSPRSVCFFWLLETASSVAVLELLLVLSY